MMNDNVTILYASQTGTAENLAREAANDLKKADIKARYLSCLDFTVEQLRVESRVLIVASTWGDGEPPDDAVDFHEALVTADIDLSHLRFAILALGDTCYVEFCKCGKDIDEALQRCGALPLLKRVDCDMDHDYQYPDWIREVAVTLKAFPVARPVEV